MASIDYEPPPRVGNTLINHEDYVYLVGGRGSDYEPVPLSSVEVFDPSTLKWHRRQARGEIPESIAFSAFANWNNLLYAFGGRIAHQRFNTLSQLDLKTLQWSSIKQKNEPAPRNSAGMVCVENQYLVLYGGIGSGGKILEDLHIFTINNGEWASPATYGTSPSPLYNFSFTLVGSLAILYGGYDEKIAYNSEVYSLNISTWHWSKETTDGQRPCGRWGHAACTVSSVLLVVAGGHTDDTGITHESWILNLKTLTWSELSLPSGSAQRWLHAVAAVTTGSTAYIVQFGGYHRENAALAATSVVQLEMEGTGEEEVSWRLVDCVTTSLPNNWRDKVEQLHRLGLVQQALHNNKTISTTPVSLVLIGPPRSGKSTLLQRLIEGVHYIVRPGEEHPSTLLASQPVPVEIRRLSSELAILQQTQWIKHDSMGQSRLLVSYFLKTLLGMMNNTSAPPLENPYPQNAEQAPPETLSIHATPSSTSESVPSDDTVMGMVTSELHAQPVTEIKLKQQSLKQSSSHPAFDMPREILSTAMRDLTPEEVEESLEGSMILHILDTGGQPECLDVLPGLLTGPSLNLLIFKLMDDLQKRYLVRFVPKEGEPPDPYVSSFTVEEAILQAYTRVSHSTPPPLPATSTSHLPSVLSRSSTMLVGTHRDQVSDEKFTMSDKQLQAKFKDIQHDDNQLIRASVERLVYAVDNTDPKDVGFIDLQEALSLTLQKEFNPLEIPLSWMMLYLAIRSTKKQVLSFQHCQIIARSCTIMDNDDLRLALWYLSHQFGVLRYYPKVAGLEDTIICDLQVLFDCISALITATCFQKAIPQEEEQLRKTGRCSVSLLRRLLQGTHNQSLPLETTLVLLDHLHIVTCMGGLEYYVPCVLRMFPVESISATARASPAPLLVAFEKGYSPLGLFTQLLVYLVSDKVEDWMLKCIALFRNMATFHVGKDMDAVTLIARPRFYEVLFEGENSEDRVVTLYQACCAIRLTVDAAIEAVKLGLNSTVKIRHNTAFYCPLPRCASMQFHPALPYGKKLKCQLSENVDRQTLSQQVWYHEVKVPIVEQSLIASSVQRRPRYTADALLKYLHGVSRWLDLGLLLGLSLSTLVEIKSSHWEDCTACLRDVLHLWLSSEDRVVEKGLRPLVAGLQDPLVGCHDIGIQLEKNVSTGGLPSSARRTVCEISVKASQDVDVRLLPIPLSTKTDFSYVDDTELDVIALADILKEAYDIHCAWKKVFLVLHVSPPELDCIESTYCSDPFKAMERAARLWLIKAYNVEKYGHPSWRKLVEAICDEAGGNDSMLALIIARNHSRL